jgi:Sec-independent protein secretion pathway component TatC
MMIAMAPLVVLFEMSVQLAKVFERRRLRAAEEEAEAEEDEEWDEHDNSAVS